MASKGSDGTGPADYRELPPEAKQAYLELIQACEAERAWPRLSVLGASTFERWAVGSNGSCRDDRDITTESAPNFGDAGEAER